MAIPREGDDTRHARLCSNRVDLAECLYKGGMMLGTVQRIRNRPASGIPHCADETVASRNVELCYFQQIDTLEPHLCGRHTELVQRNLLITPSGNRLLDTSLARDRGRDSARLRKNSRSKASFHESAPVRFDSVNQYCATSLPFAKCRGLGQSRGAGPRRATALEKWLSPGLHGRTSRNS